MKIQNFFLVFFLSVFSFSVFASMISETQIKDLGVSDFVVDGAQVEECKEIEFILPPNFTKEMYPIFSVHANFLPVVSNDSHLTVFFNGEEIKKVKSTSFLNDFSRIDLPHEGLLEKNSLKLCFKNSYTTTKTIFFSDSVIGYYFKPDFSRDDSFLLDISKRSIRLFEEFKVIATLKNYGSESETVKLRYRKITLDNETPETELVKGKTTIEVEIGPCLQRDERNVCIMPSQASFEYYLRPRVLGPISLLPAIAEFENEFGEVELIESDRPLLEITEPEIKLKAFIRSPKEEFFVNKPLSMKIVLVNDGSSPLYNVNVKIEDNDKGIVNAAQKDLFIDYIGAKQVIEREFTASSQVKGSFELGCSANYLSGEYENSLCQKSVVEFKEEKLSQEIIAAGVLVLVSLGTFIYLFYIR